MIVVENLVKDFGARRAVDHVSFEVNPGEVLGFLGPNGAGKSTTMRMITGFLPPTSGTATVCGHDILAAPVEARRRIGYLPENAPSYGDMTVSEFLDFVAEMRAFSGEEKRGRVEAAIERCFLEHVRNQTIETLSKGYRQRTCLAQALLHAPPVLIMDEPTDGLDPNQKQIVRNMIQEMAREKVIVLSTHVLEEVEAMCNRVIIISDGKLVTDSTPEQLRERSESYNAVTVTLTTHAKEAEESLRALPDVAGVEVRHGGEHASTLRVVPKSQQPVAASVMNLAAEKGWMVTAIQTDRGRLDDVFRNLTTTEDVAREVTGGVS